MPTAAIQAVFIKGHETRTSPNLHTAYRIDVQGPVKSWTVWRRYSEFDDLHAELTSSTGSAPPAALPSKHAFSLSWRRRTINDDALIKERVEGLELYLRAIVGSKDSRWRDSPAFKEFLSVPSTTNTNISTATPQFTSSSWLDEHASLQSALRDVRADVNRRNALSDQGDVGGSHQTNVQAKKKLAAALARIGHLAGGLDDLGKAGMKDGEMQRRGDMISRLQDECEKLSKMVVASRQSQSSRAFSSNSAAERNPAPQADRTALLGSRAPVARVFGASLETEETRPLEDTGLVQLQSNMMDVQDAQLGQLSSILKRQQQIGLAIGTEIEQQNEILDKLTADVDRVGGKLGGAKRQLNKLQS